MKNKLINIQKDIVRKKKFTKIEIKKMIFKSIIRNQNVKPIIRVKATRKDCNNSYLSFLSKQKNNTCLKKGRIKGVYKQFNFSRHYIKYLASNNNLQNIKIACW